MLVVRAVIRALAGALCAVGVGELVAVLALVCGVVASLELETARLLALFLGVLTVGLTLR
jgi:hypothetical protein